MINAEGSVVGIVTERLRPATGQPSRIEIRLTNGGAIHLGTKDGEPFRIGADVFVLVYDGDQPDTSTRYRRA